MIVSCALTSAVTDADKVFDGKYLLLHGAILQLDSAYLLHDGNWQKDGCKRTNQ